MSEEGKMGKERAFTIELGSAGHLRNVSLADSDGEGVLIEGTIGKLLRARFAEGTVLEVIGTDGVLRMDLADDDISRTDEGRAEGSGGGEA